MDFAQFLEAERDGELKGFVLAVFIDREGGAFLHARFGPPRHGIRFVDHAGRGALRAAGDAEHAGRIARVAEDYAAATELGGDFGQAVEQDAAILAGGIEGFLGAFPFSIAEKFRVGFAVFIGADEPAMRRTRVDAADSLHVWGCGGHVEHESLALGRFNYAGHPGALR